MRNKFDAELEGLHSVMIEMGWLCEYAIREAVQLLREKNSEKLAAVKKAERQIDEKEREIEQLCMRLIMQQQPVAGDLRTITSALKMISDMERLGDQALDIAEMCQLVCARDNQLEADVFAMADAAIKMVGRAIDSFVKGDTTLASEVMRMDDTVDNWFLRIKDELVSCIAENSDDGEYFVDMLMIAKYLERIGDHAENIAGWVEYSVTGEHI